MRTLLLILLLAGALVPPTAAQEDAGEAVLLERVTVQPMTPTSLKRALEELFDGTGVTVELAPEVVNLGFGPRWLDLRNVRRQDAMRVLLRAASGGDARYSFQRDGTKITVRKDPVPVEPPAADFKNDPRVAGTRGFVQVDRTPLRTALRRTPVAARVSLVVLPHLSDLPVSLNLRDGTAEQVLQEIVRQLQAQHDGVRFFWSSEGEVYVLDARKVAGR